MLTAKKPARLERYLDHWRRAEAEGVEVLTFKCCGCGEELKAGRPPADDPLWDSVSVCPYCEVTFSRVAHHNGFVDARRLS